MTTRGIVLALLVACGPTYRTTPDGAQNGDAPRGHDDGATGDTSPGSYLVYAHSNTVLYTIDLVSKNLVTVGNFNAPLVTVGTSMKPDVITDLAVAPDGTIYVISET